MSTTTQPRFEAEIMFLDPYSASAAIAPLTRVGFDVEVMDWVDEGGTPYVWAIAMCKPGRDDGELWSEVQAIVEPFDGEVDSAGTGNIPIKDAVAEHDRKIPDKPWYPELKRQAEIERKQAGIEYRIYPAA